MIYDVFIQKLNLQGPLFALDYAFGHSGDERNLVAFLEQNFGFENQYKNSDKNAIAHFAYMHTKDAFAPKHEELRVNSDISFPKMKTTVISKEKQLDLAQKYRT